VKALGKLDLIFRNHVEHTSKRLISKEILDKVCATVFELVA